jgi:hypothetical protein
LAAKAKKLASLGGAVALAAALTIGSGALAAPAHLDPLGRLADGSVDFSGWTLSSAAAGDSLATDQFLRNGVTYTVDVRAPGGSANPMFASVITNTQAGDSHSYAYRQGSASTSDYMVSVGGTRDAISCYDRAYYTHTLQGSPAAAKSCEDDSVGGTTLKYSEVVRVIADGRVAHDVTVTNTGASPLANFDFGVMLDTMLDSDDRVPLTKSTNNALYMENTGFRLHLAMTGGDRMLAGPWPRSDTLQDWVNIRDFNSGDVVLTGVDSAIEYQAVNRTLAVGESLTMSYEERVFSATELQTGKANVKLVDDDLSGATVTPTDPAAVELIGEPLTDVGFADEDAAPLVPAGYRIVAVQNVDLYDDDNASVQEIVVHLTHIHTLGTITQTRTVTYEGAGDATPAAVTQTQTFDFDKDEATGVTTYTNGTGLDAVPNPEIEGYWPLRAGLPAVAAGAAPTTTTPADAAVTVRYVTDEPQVVIASEHGVEGGQATVSGSDSFDPRGAGDLAFAWDLDNDGAYDDGDQVEAALALPLAGAYPVGLQVTDALGRTNTATFQVQASNVAPVVSIGANVEIKADGVFKRDGSFTDPGADKWSGEVLYGDGSAAQKLTLDGKGFKLDHRYTKAGKYTVTVRIKDEAGGATGEAKIVVTVPPALAVTGPQDLAPVTAAGALALIAGLGLALVARRRQQRVRA